MTLNTCWASSLESTTTTGIGDANAISDAATNNEWDDTYATVNAAAGNQAIRFPENFKILIVSKFQLDWMIMNPDSRAFRTDKI